MTALERASAFLASGWVPLPVPYRQKRTLLPHWPAQRLADAESRAAEWFADARGNVGVSLGEPSGGLVDVDLDCPEAVDLASRFLPATRTFGRPGNPRSHWLYQASGATTAKFAELAEKGVKPQMLVELRSTGCQTVFPGSTHESGEPIAWTEPQSPVAALHPTVLRRAVESLAAAVLLVRAGMAPAEAVDVVRDGAAALAHPRAALVRRWLGTPATAPEGRRERRRQAVQERVAAGSPLAKAAARYSAEHPADWPRSGGECPGCGHQGCFGRLGDATDRWVCFSASHAAPGVAGKDCFTGDALDLAAHAAGLAVGDFLRREGYLPPAVERPECEFRRGDGHHAVAAALDALAQDDRVFQHGTRLVLVGYEQSSGAARDDAPSAAMVPLTVGHAWSILSERLRWVAFDPGSGESPGIDPPAKVVAASVDWGLWPGARPLHGIVTVPVLRTDGRLVDRPGYDPTSRLFFAPRGPVPVVAAHPDRGAAVAAAQALAEVVEQFPFVAPGHRVAWIAALAAARGDRGTGHRNSAATSPRTAGEPSAVAATANVGGASQ